MHIINASHSQFHLCWDQLFHESEFQYPLYTPASLAFYKEYGVPLLFEDLSFVIMNGESPVLGILMTVHTLNGNQELSCCGLPVFYLENPHINSSEMGAAYKLLKEKMHEWLHHKGLGTVVYQDFLGGGTLSFLGRFLLEGGAQGTPFFTQLIDLTLSPDELYRQVRKSYKSLINWGKKNLVIECFHHQNMTPSVMEGFRQLHLHAAGKETRSHSTWDKHYEMVLNQEAFVLTGKLSEQLVTAAFFSFSSKYCYYGVSASNRDLFDKPLSHAILWQAVLYAQELGCHWFETGTQFFMRQPPNLHSHVDRVSHHKEEAKLSSFILPNAKELNISSFKHGLGGTTQVRLNILWKSHT
ncbi:hypothetical protein WDW89_22645 [Deltaproteobacteria bacterium TL4]